MAGRLRSNGSASLFTVASPSASRASIARRVGSARAAKVDAAVVRGQVVHRTMSVNYHYWFNALRSRSDLSSPPASRSPASVAYLFDERDVRKIGSAADLFLDGLSGARGGYARAGWRGYSKALATEKARFVADGPGQHVEPIRRCSGCSDEITPSSQCRAPACPSGTPGAPRGTPDALGTSASSEERHSALAVHCGTPALPVTCGTIGASALRHFGTSALRHFGTSALRHFGTPALQHHGTSIVRNNPVTLDALRRFAIGRSLSRPVSLRRARRAPGLRSGRSAPRAGTRTGPDVAAPCEGLSRRRSRAALRHLGLEEGFFVDSASSRGGPTP